MNRVANINSVLAIHQQRKFWLKIAVALMCVVVFCTTYALILPAITASNRTYCGLAEHAHTAECYQTQQVTKYVLTCGYDDASEADVTDETGEGPSADEASTAAPVTLSAEGSDGPGDTGTSAGGRAVGSDAQSPLTQEANSGADAAVGALAAAAEASDAALAISDSQDGEGSATSGTSATTSVVAASGTSATTSVVAASGTSATTSVVAASGTSAWSGCPEASAEGQPAQGDVPYGTASTDTTDATLETQSAAHVHTAACYTEVTQDEQTLTCTQPEHVHSEEAGCFTAPDTLTFNCQTDTLTAQVTIPFSDDLPENLTCTLEQVATTDANYDAMYNAAAAALTPGRALTDTTILRLNWENNGEPYNMPDTITATVDIQYTQQLDTNAQLKLVALEPTDEAQNSEGSSVSVASDSGAADAQETPSPSDDASDSAIDLQDSSDATDDAAAELLASGTSAWSACPEAQAEGLAAQGDVPSETTTPEATVSIAGTYLASPAAALTLCAPATDASLTMLSITAATTTITDNETPLDAAATTTAATTYTATSTETLDATTTSGTIMLMSANAPVAVNTEKTIDANTEGLSFYQRVDDVSEIEADPNASYVLVFADGQKALGPNDTILTGTAEGETSTWSNNQDVYIQPIKDTDGNQYFLLRKGATGYVSEDDESLHWTIQGTSATGFTLYNQVDASATSAGRKFWMGENFTSDEESGPRYVDNITIDPVIYGNDGNTYSRFDRTAHYQSSFRLFGYSQYYNSLITSDISVHHKSIRSNDYGCLWLSYEGSADADVVSYEDFDKHDYDNFYYSYSSYGGYTNYVGTTGAYAASDKYTRYSGHDISDDILIYKLVDADSLTIEDDIAEAAQADSEGVIDKRTSPTYSNETSSISSSKSGDATSAISSAVADATAQYASDSATSQIEDTLGMHSSGLSGDSKTSAQTANNGRVLTDKSVVYAADDYGASSLSSYGTYGAGDFSVTLSALGQEWTTKDVDSYSTPIDVMFIFDISTSMASEINTDDESSTKVPRWAASIDAINEVAKVILQDPDSRVGLTVFGDYAEEVLSLDHYEWADGTSDEDKQLLTYDLSVYPSSSYKSYRGLGSVKTGAGLQHQSGEEVSIDLSSDATDIWGYTFTQAGLQSAYESFAATTSTTVEKEVNGVKTTIKRQPVVILLSDGSPSVASYNYMDPMNDATFGNGDTANLLSYYTILSANYFKNKISIHYGKQTNFYSIGLAVTSTLGKATLDPNKADLNTIVYNTKNYKNWGSGYSGWSTLEDFGILIGGSDGVVTREFSNRYTDKDASYAAYGSASLGVSVVDGIGFTHRYLSAVASANPYFEDLDYCDGSYIGNMTAVELANDMKSIIEEVQMTDAYGFLLADGTNLDMTDTIGAGMDVKGAPVLRYFGKNYEASSSTTGTDSAGTYTSYAYNEKGSANYAAVTRQDSNLTSKAEKGIVGKSGQEIDISTITVKVYTAENSATGNARVEFSIPQDAVPVLYPELYSTFYYEEMPVRLIYRVGLSSAEITSLNAQTSAIDATYYVGAYGEGSSASTTASDSAISTLSASASTATTSRNTQTAGLAASTVVTFTPAVSADGLLNTYYYDAEGNSLNTDYDDIAKAANTTSTSSYVLDESMDASGQVTQLLGNNGVLKVSRAKTTPDITIEKVWPNGEPSDVTSVTVDVYRQFYDMTVEIESLAYSTPELYQTVTITKDSAGNWKAIVDAPLIDDSGRYIDYYFVERTEVEGYSPQYARKVEQVSGGLVIEGAESAAASGEDTQVALTARTLTLEDGTQVEAYPAMPGETVQVMNCRAYSLPSSGGPGVAAPVAAGCALVAFATMGFALTTRRRTNASEVSREIFR